ncbi:TlpA family protein disulfide reductase [Peribacillus saganii]|uniref:TlpA family protein disulfide reductase n=1 Tax=Peribacillus saganii TaxID=2303992 RepID=A0A372LR57_9BACI|nr:redoxin domain-containing protein [Peribacillus saganii]RFU70407.1 TlpA family protein disulfide reductase [Peribacillus saganii]
MFKKIIASVVLMLLISVAIVQAMEKKKVDNLPGLKIGAKAPDIQLSDLDGNTVKLSDLKGKKVMLNFWATWCPPCKEEMPAMQDFYNEMDDNEAILSVNIDPENDVKDFAGKMGITFPIVLDHGGKVYDSYQVISIPTTYFIDSDGIIREKFIGAMTKDEMESKMDNL